MTQVSTLKSREAKIALLRGISTGTRSINELLIPQILVWYYDKASETYTNRKTKEKLSREQFFKLKRGLPPNTRIILVTRELRDNIPPLAFRETDVRMD
jgi:hypothetical protein